MICAIFERRPPSTRNITDQRAARPVGTFEFEDQLRHHENVEVIKAKIKELGYTMAATPNKTTHPEFDFVVYIEPAQQSTPQGARSQLMAGGPKKKAVRMVGASGVSRRLPLPSKRKR